MAFDIKSFLTLKIISLVVFSLFLLVVIIVLFVIKKRLNKKVVIKETEEEEEIFVKRQLNELRNSAKPPEIMLNSIDLFARNFFIDAFNLNSNLDYAEMMHIFQEKRKRRAEAFCQKMLEVLYSGGKINKERINYFLNELDGIINEEHPELKDRIITQREQISMPARPQI